MYNSVTLLISLRTYVEFRVIHLSEMRSLYLLILFHSFPFVCDKAWSVEGIPMCLSILKTQNVDTPPVWWLNWECASMHWSLYIYIYIYIYIYLYIFRLFFFLMILWGETERAIRFVVVMEVGTLDCWGFFLLWDGNLVKLVLNFKSAHNHYLPQLREVCLVYYLYNSKLILNKETIQIFKVNDLCHHLFEWNGRWWYHPFIFVWFFSSKPASVVLPAGSRYDIVLVFLLPPYFNFAFRLLAFQDWIFWEAYTS